MKAQVPLVEGVRELESSADVAGGLLNYCTKTFNNKPLFVDTPTFGYNCAARFRRGSRMHLLAP